MSEAWSGMNWADLMAAQRAFGTDFYDMHDGILEVFDETNEPYYSDNAIPDNFEIARTQRNQQRYLVVPGAQTPA